MENSPFIGGLPSYKMVDLSMAMLNNQMIYSPFTHHLTIQAAPVDKVQVQLKRVEAEAEMVRIDPPESQVVWWDPFWVGKMPLGKFRICC